MKLSILGLTLCMLTASAIDMVLFEDDRCDNFDENEYSHMCYGIGYDTCCGEFGSSGHAFGAATVSMGATAIQNTPVLRGCNEDPAHPVTQCDNVRQSWTLANDPDNPGTFPCGAAAQPLTYNGYIVNSIVTRRRSEIEIEVRGPAEVGGGTGWGIVENGTIYGIKDGSETWKEFAARKDAMTTKERRSFIIMNSEVRSEGAKIY